MPKIESPDDRQSIEDQCRALRQAMGKGDLEKAAQINHQLAERLLDFAHLL